MNDRKTVILYIACGALALVGLLATWKAADYRQKMVVLRGELLAAKRAGHIERVNHLAEHPVLLFESLRVSWSDLAPRLEQIYGADVGKDVVGTFPVPHQFSGSNISEIQFDQAFIHFPQYGAYYLHTTTGFFKILLIDPTETVEAKIIATSKFVAGNSVHSLADERRICPVYRQGIYTPSNLATTFFASDQPLKLHCYSISLFLAWLLDHQGYDVRLVGLQTSDRLRGHFVVEAFLPELGKFAMIDPDYGTMIRSLDGIALSVDDIVSRLDAERLDELLVVDLANKHNLRSIYNNDEPMSEFCWTPDKSNLASPFVNADHYLGVWRDYSSHVTYLRESDGAWQVVGALNN